MNHFAKININKLKKFLQNRGYRIYKKQKSYPKSIENFFYTTMMGIFFVGLFYVAPSLKDFYIKNLNKNETVLNNSNLNFNRVLEGKDIKKNRTLNESDEVEFGDLFTDVFDFDISEKDTVRLSASTINQLFKDEDYNLNDIRKNKLVKPITIDILPSEIKSIESTKKKKRIVYSNSSTFNFRRK